MARGSTRGSQDRTGSRARGPIGSGDGTDPSTGAGEGRRCTEAGRSGPRDGQERGRRFVGARQGAARE